MKNTVLTTHNNLERLSLLDLHFDYSLRTAVSLKDERVEAIHRVTRKKRAEISNRLSFSDILDDARSMGMPYISVFEDDVYFTEKVCPDTVAAKLPADFKACYLGAYYKYRNGSMAVWYDKDAGIVQLKGNWLIWGSHAVIWGKGSYGMAVKELRSPRGMITDQLIYKLLIPSGGVYALVPPAAFQREGLDAVHRNLVTRNLRTDSVNNLKRVLGVKS